MRRDFKHGMCCKTEEKKSTDAHVRKKMIILWDSWTWRKRTSYSKEVLTLLQNQVSHHLGE